MILAIGRTWPLHREATKYKYAAEIVAIDSLGLVYLGIQVKGALPFILLHGQLAFLNDSCGDV